MNQFPKILKNDELFSAAPGVLRHLAKFKKMIDKGAAVNVASVPQGDPPGVPSVPRTPAANFDGLAGISAGQRQIISNFMTARTRALEDFVAKKRRRLQLLWQLFHALHECVLGGPPMDIFDKKGEIILPFAVCCCCFYFGQLLYSSPLIL